jgi:hypothetical protein
MVPVMLRGGVKQWDLVSGRPTLVRPRPKPRKRSAHDFDLGRCSDPIASGPVTGESQKFSYITLYTNLSMVLLHLYNDILS